MEMSKNCVTNIVSADTYSCLCNHLRYELTNTPISYWWIDESKESPDRLLRLCFEDALDTVGALEHLRSYRASLIEWFSENTSYRWKISVVQKIVEVRDDELLIDRSQIGSSIDLSIRKGQHSLNQILEDMNFEFDSYVGTEVSRDVTYWDTQVCYYPTFPSFDDFQSEYPSTNWFVLTP